MSMTTQHYQFDQHYQCDQCDQCDDDVDSDDFDTEHVDHVFADVGADYSDNEDYDLYTLSGAFDSSFQGNTDDYALDG